MKKAGVYVIRGTDGERIGQTNNINRRLPEVMREHGKCIGDIRDVKLYPQQGREARLRLERRLISELNPSCNPYHR